MAKGDIVCGICLSKGTQLLCSGVAPDDKHLACSIWKKIDISETFPTNAELKANFTSIKGKTLNFDITDQLILIKDE